MRKKFFLLILTMLAFLTADAQSYVVYAVTGKVELVMPSGKHPVKIRETLYPSSVVNLPYGATLELLDVDSRKQYTLRTPGKGKLESLMADRRNSVLKLTSKYFDYVLAQVKGKSQMVTHRCSDPATVTREIEVDSMYMVENDSVPAPVPVGPITKQDNK